MFRLTTHQVDAFRKDHLDDFFQRIEQFLVTHVAGIDQLIPDLPAFVRAGYRIAKGAGRHSERDVVHVILNEIETSVYHG